MPDLIRFSGGGAHREFCGTMTLPCLRKPSHNSTGRDNARAKFNDAPRQRVHHGNSIFRQLIAPSKSIGTPILNIDSFSALRLPREILFGENQVAALGKMSSRLGNRALLCTDTRFSGTPAFKDICRHLEDASIKIEVFGRVEPDVPCENVYQSVESARAFAPDVVIGLGGGSCIDLAKCASLLLTHGGKLEDYYGEFKVPGPVIPTIAVPTTSGQDQK